MSPLKILILFIATLSLSWASSPAIASGEDEVALYNSAGKAEAYIALDDEMTIYLWSGKPVAYLEKNGSKGYHVYGFNGEHLGWFVRGIIWDHDGNGACAAKEAMRSTASEPFKSFKQFKPFKSFTKFAPFQPTLSNQFGDVPCRFLLAEGGK
jgi:hypothetical protein